MTTLLSFDLERRRRTVATGGPWSALADGLSRELEPLLHAAPPVPDQKARLTRHGGRCERDGSLLLFDPWQPRDHRCSVCGATYEGRVHDDWWALGAQLWTAERAVHASALYALRGDRAHRDVAMRILDALASRYDTYPNSDNVLGPSRPFFSTYLESIWTLNICHAVALLSLAHDGEIDRVSRTVRERVIAPSAELIAGYHEGRSNRQAWNEAALLAAYRVLGDDAAFSARVRRSDGVVALLSHGLLGDGTWFEGENYHLFAHRGLWQCVQIVRASSDAHAMSVLRASPNLMTRYAAAFSAPFAGVLPDECLPSRRDSPYRVSILQWRIAEHLELGYAHGADTRIARLLARLYGNDSTRDVSERWRSTADAERPEPPHRLDRSTLSWRALLMANEEPVRVEESTTASVCMPSQGLAVLRRERGATYVALDGGHSGGGHGHPDRLALTLQRGTVRWLEDPGAGSYVDPTLHWYRSTLAHHAPLVDGASQSFDDCELLAFDDRGGAGWMVKRLRDEGRDITIERRIVVCDSYLVDVLDWSSAREIALSLPVAGPCEVAPGLELASATDGRAARGESLARDGAGGKEDGFDFARLLERYSVPAHTAVELTLHPHQLHPDPTERPTARCIMACSANAELTRAIVPGPPATGESTRAWLTARGLAGRIVSVMHWPSDDERADVSTATIDLHDEAALAVVETQDGTRATHGIAPHGWHIALSAGAATSSIDLEYLPAQLDADVSHADDPGDPVAFALEPLDVPLLLSDHDRHPRVDTPLHFVLGERHYRGTELPWAEAGAIGAEVELWRTGSALIVEVSRSAGVVVADHEGAERAPENQLDNERSDTNADGVQWYLRMPGEEAWHDAGLVVPIANGVDRVDAVDGVARMHALLPASRAQPEVRVVVADGGWRMRLTWSIASLPLSPAGVLAIQLVVNERPAHRERRRGQLVLTGADGFGYLRGDREDPRYVVLLRLR